MTQIAFLLYPDVTALDAAPSLRGAGPPSRRGRRLGGVHARDAGMVVTAASAVGIDMEPRLAASEAGDDRARALQLVTEYDPDLPFDSGSLEKADEETRQRATPRMVPAARKRR